MKAVISNRIYFKTDNEYLKEIIAKLTYRIEKPKTSKHMKFSSVEIIKNYKMHPGGLVSVPQGRLDLVPEGLEIVDKRILYPAPFPNPRHELRDSQIPVFNEVTDTCFINAKVGWGKTFTALHIARKLGQRTLVVTHTTMLRDQWIEEIRELFDMEPGIIGSGKFDIEDRAIVVGNIQTITKMIPELNKEFGTIILDEAHHVPATTFANVIDGMYARYRIALSGTIDRTDGKHVIFRDYFGDHFIKPPQSHTMNPTVKIVKTGVYLSPGLAWVKKINSLLYDENYQQFVAATARVQMAKGHKVLIVADRVEFLNNVKELIGEDCILITGSTSFEERKTLIEQVAYGSKSCIAGSRQIFSEGISVNQLSCVILPVPGSNLINLEQVIGRIQRIHEGKLNPVVIDMNFSSPAEKKHDANRLAFYVSKGWYIDIL